MPRSESRLMRRLPFAALLLVVACGGGDAGSGEPVTLYDAYSAALLNPQAFDDYISDNNLRTPEFHACVVAARTRLSEQWEQITASCDTNPDVTDRAGCKANDYTNVSSVLNGMEVALRTDSTFASTQGGMAMQVKREALGPSVWEESSNAWLPVLRTVLVCE